MNQIERNRVARVRRLAKTSGYVLRKSRALEGAYNFGGFMIVDPSCNGCVAGPRFEFETADVEAWLAS